jgi:hypothetical protein
MILIPIICISIILVMLAGLAKRISPDEEKMLREERTDLLSQAESFLSEDDYELLPDLFNQIAEISLKLGEQDLAEDFKNRAEMMSALIEIPDGSLEPEIRDTPTPTTSSPIQPPRPPPEPTYKIEDTSLSAKLSKLKSLVDVISTPRLTPQPTRPSEMPKVSESPPSYQPVTPPPSYQPVTPPPSYQPVTPPPFYQPAEPQPNPAQPPSFETKSLIEERKTEIGAPLESGIVPTIVKDEKDILFEILVEKLPLLPDNEKQKAIDKILSFEPGASREAWLKVFLIRNKKYAKK